MQEEGIFETKKHIFIICKKILYSLDSKGKTRIWSIETNSNKFRVHSGILDGQIVTSEWTTCFGKNIGKANETSDIEQCQLEVEAKYKKQLKSGYFENIDDINKIQFIEPMLAKKYSDYAAKINLKLGEYVAQCKYNGMRCIATVKGLTTRTGEEILSVPHISESLKPFFEIYPDAVLDGELFNEALRENLNEIIKLTRKTVYITDNDLIRSREIIKYYVYDFYYDGFNKNESYTLRKRFIDENLNYEFIEKVPTILIDSEETLNNYYNDLIEQGHEGIMLRLANGGYENKRSKNLLKFKPTDDSEFTFLGVSEGKGNWSGMAKIIHLRMKNGKEFDATFKGTQSEAKEFILNYTHLIGKEVTVYYNGFTGLGTPNYGQFDVNNYIKK